MQTTIHQYVFNIDNELEKEAYGTLCQKLNNMGLTCFESHGGGSHYRPELNGKIIELDTTYLFGNQWNTAPIEGISELGLRIFDWAQDFEPYGNRYLKRGHWLEQTNEMRKIRNNTVSCGYCGRQEIRRGKSFCFDCLDDEYLKSNELHLLRLRPIDSTGSRWALTQDEKDFLIPLYKKAQLVGSTKRGKERLAKQRASIEHELETSKANAQTKRDGLIWLLDHGVKIDNCIYYGHTNKFCFGWRNPVDAAFKAELLDILVEFPFEYEIK